MAAGAPQDADADHRYHHDPVPRGERRRAETERYLQEHSAQKAREAFQRYHGEFVQARRKFKSGEVNQALKRLTEMRNKEVAHTEIEPDWTAGRPKQTDLCLVFDAV